MHEVFVSEGEIYYRRSYDNGISWEITKRISLGGNGSNNHPSIVANIYNPNEAYSEMLRIVWQRKLDDYHYEIWDSYSTDIGTSWTMPAIVPGCSNVTVSYYQSNPGSGPGPTPVVGSYIVNPNYPSFLLVFADEEGLRYRFTNPPYFNWSIPLNDIVPGSDASSVTWFPSVANYNTQGSNVNLIYDDRFSHVYSQIYNSNGTWTNRVVVDWVGSYNRTSSIALDYSNNTLGVWSGWNGNNYIIRFRNGYSNGTWSHWCKEWSISGVNSLGPAITYYNKGVPYPYGIDILWYISPRNEIRQKKYYGTGDT